MNAKVKLSDIVEGMEFQSDELSAYLNKNTGEVIPVPDDAFEAARRKAPIEELPEWQQSSIKVAQEILQGGKDYLELPSKFDINEYRLMERFGLSREDTHLSETLLAAVQGRGAFRRFKETLHRFGVTETWYEYREAAFKQIAKEWCEGHGIECVEDV
jgi:hypothetical protein